ncbi:hypothetical protein ACPOL_5313 [Acidisarcina polymorpha]|uniref:ABC-type transport auxiliary lipoprotein component domain-containing protein n=1 Tax=Acidisarcina polymorpha TaxID=2211140 RepID=A0A2Z5G5Q4_9BACT|nr:ABC-type transport auxiliary lipoprotein family protein [Acidisarcina polymorpha]AXC14563.1 hypothetical protein ACPOL_5313 [Acidisarcina polymorpha]
MIVKRLSSQWYADRSATKKSGVVNRVVGVVLVPLLVGSGLGLLGGCGKTEPIKYYQLTVPAGGAPEMTQPATPVTIVVGRLLTSEIYLDDHVVYAINAQQMGTYEYQRWVEVPPLMIQQIFLRELRASGRYKGVYTPESKEVADYSLRGHLYDFKEVDSPNAIVARVTMELEMRNMKTGDVVWKHYYNHDEPVAAKTMPDVVAALDKNVQMAASELAAGLDQYFAAHPVK